MKSQDWIGKHIDKDIIFRGNKIYSPTTCAFVRPETNYFLTNVESKNDLPVGVCKKRGSQHFSAHCRNPFTLKNEFLGVFDTPDEAHSTWKRRKHELACLIADLESDARVKRSLRNMFLQADPDSEA